MGKFRENTRKRRREPLRQVRGLSKAVQETMDRQYGALMEDIFRHKFQGGPKPSVPPVGTKASRLASAGFIELMIARKEDRMAAERDKYQALQDILLESAMNTALSGPLGDVLNEIKLSNQDADTQQRRRCYEQLRYYMQVVNVQTGSEGER